MSSGAYVDVTFVPGHEQESPRVRAHVFVLLHAEHHGLEAAGICALAQERHAIPGLKPMRVGGALQSFIRPAEPRLVRRQFVGAGLIVGSHEHSLSASPSSTPVVH